MEEVKDLSEAGSDSLSKFVASGEKDFAGTPTVHNTNRRLISKDGNGTVNTITEAIKKASCYHLRQGKAGSGFIARDITFEKDQPSTRRWLFLLVQTVYRCNIIGFQDTLYVNSTANATVDFIFGNAAVLLQNCSIFAQKPMPMPGQKITITLKAEVFLNQNTDISIHACRILPTPDLVAANGSFQTYLGRPWRWRMYMYSRVVFMLSYMDDHIDPRGWSEWNGSFASDT
ncbi:hypothetical protein V6N13_032460 [Hibiscus sabdariffa]